MSDLRDAARQALEFIKVTNARSEFWLVPGSNLNKTVNALKAALEKPNEDYERGFVDGMSEQAKRSVDRAVNRMANAVERTLTDEVIADLWHQNGGFHHHFARAVERYLKGEE